MSNDSETSVDKATHKQSAAEHQPGQTVYVYGSAGITEREGGVPKWLWGVIAVLVVWGGYYLVAYWNAPVGGT
jgi:hypothetical protein